ncbi:S9 family peptidase [Brachybacterium huguangmaarense]
MEPEPSPETSTSPFADLDAFVGLERCTGAALSPDGTRLVASITRLADDADRYVTSLWELPTGRDGSVPAPVRLTRGTDGETLVAMTRGGDLLFSGRRPGADEDPDRRSTLRLLPRHGGESLAVLRRPGGIHEVLTARDADAVVLVADALPSARDAEQEAEIADERADRKVSGILHESFPVRYWDHDLGPGRPQLFAVEDPSAEEWELRRLTSFGAEERLHDAVLSADGTTVIAALTRLVRGTATRSVLVEVDVATGEVRELVSDPERNLGGPVLSRDGSTLLAVSSTVARDDVPLHVDLVRVDRTTGEIALAAPELPAWPGDVVLSDDGVTAHLTSDRLGHGTIWRLDVAAGELTELTHDHSHYTALAVDGASGDIHVLADAIDAPPLPMVLRGGEGEPEAMPCPVEAPAVPGTLTEVTATAADGTPLRAWLCLPEGASADEPAPTLLWIHGGPFGSWNAWTWRWNPWTATARGYAVLLPDPAISTGYGREMIERGWSELGGAPFDDIMRLMDAALERDDLDATRTAALGGSYGGYMANWVAGHTGDRFRCVVTHASLWALEQFRGTTDTAEHWAAHLSDAHNALYSPHTFVGDIEVPMLVIHGDKDYRVPIGEGLRLWYELLASQAAEPGGNPHRFLYFPDEGHWVLRPGNSALWYETVYAFCDQHVLGKEWARPRLLG